ncbi:MAG TPA: chromate resistance protein ChrB domain-containing protein [Polyangia bacterium]|nr:chromate resistance protein ChrB domain-containing protein [Polyangia bacterium]
MERTAAPRWLLLIHQLPPTPAYLRVKTARQLQKIGAVAVKDSVYVLPQGERELESFTWVAREIAGGGGESSLCESSFIGGTTAEAVESLFQRARGKDYQELAGEVRAALQGLGRGRRPPEGRRAAGEAALARARRRLAEIAELDFFGAPGREASGALIAALEARLRRPEEPASAPETAPAPRGAVWVTRRGVHVDRIASAWLIRRFIDREARLKFVAARGYVPRAGELRFDMFEAEHTHEGDACTYEVLARRFGVADPAVAAIGEVVHDIDVRDGKYGRPETPGIERAITGIALTEPDDPARIALGSKLFDALYEAWRRKKT